MAVYLKFRGAALLAAIAVGCIGSASALTATVNGLADNTANLTFQEISGAVNYVQAQDPTGPHVINVTTDALPVADDEVVINTPMTINGDADNNGVKCDCLVDVAAIQNKVTSLGQSAKCYIELQTSGSVLINNLKIHPNADAVNTAATRVDGIRAYSPDSGEGTYTLDHVFLSGSDSNNNYESLQTSEVLYIKSGEKRWSNQAASGNAVINLTKIAGLNGGFYNAVLNDCHAGLGFAYALNLVNDSGGHTTVNGGLYGHCGLDAIRISGSNNSIIGTPTDRVRLVRFNQEATGGHGLEMVTDASADMVTYVDSGLGNNPFNPDQTQHTANMFAFRASTALGTFSHCRALGYDSPNKTSNNGVYWDLQTVTVVNVSDCTFVGLEGNPNPFQTSTKFDATLNVSDSIFTSMDLGMIINGNNDSIGVVNLDHCAIPTDGYTSESLNVDAPITTGTTTIFDTNTLHDSPHYMLTVSSYDWSDAQGSADPLNGPGNANVLRPSNPTYSAARSDGTALVGGAGPATAGIKADDWMLM